MPRHFTLAQAFSNRWNRRLPVSRPHRRLHASYPRHLFPCCPRAFLTAADYTVQGETLLPGSLIWQVACTSMTDFPAPEVPNNSLLHIWRGEPCSMQLPFINTRRSSSQFPTLPSGFQHPKPAATQHRRSSQGRIDILTSKKSPYRPTPEDWRINRAAAAAGRSMHITKRHLRYAKDNLGTQCGLRCLLFYNYVAAMANSPFAALFGSLAVDCARASI